MEGYPAYLTLLEYTHVNSTNQLLVQQAFHLLSYVRILSVVPVIEVQEFRNLHLRGHLEIHCMGRFFKEVLQSEVRLS